MKKIVISFFLIISTVELCASKSELPGYSSIDRLKLYEKKYLKRVDFGDSVLKWSKNHLFTSYLPLTAGNDYPLSGTLYGANAVFNGSISSGPMYGTYMQGKQLYLLNGTGGAKVTITGSNYGFAFEQPNDQPSILLRRADGVTNTLQSWDGVGNTTVVGRISAASLISANYMEGKQLYLLNGTGGAKVTITGNNYGFAFEQPSDQPGLLLRRADGATNTLQTWDGVGNSKITGNLGIGTAASSDRLTVSGSIKAKKVIVSQTGWPDYVFGSSYSLRPLTDVKNFIAQHKRLPEMPSAKEVEEKGINVGDNQALLLKKIEELTLYVIQLDESNKKLVAEVALLKQKKADK